MDWLYPSASPLTQRPARQRVWRLAFVLMVILAALIGGLPARAAGPAQRVKDINTTGGGSFIPNNSSAPQRLTARGDSTTEVR